MINFSAASGLQQIRIWLLVHHWLDGGHPVFCYGCLVCHCISSHFVWPLRHCPGWPQLVWDGTSAQEHGLRLHGVRLQRRERLWQTCILEREILKLLNMISPSFLTAGDEWVRLNFVDCSKLFLFHPACLAHLIEDILWLNK